MLEKIRKSKLEIQEEIIKNEKLIDKYDRNAKILSVNTIENKLQYFLFISCIFYWISTFSMLFMEFPALSSLSPFETFPLVTIGNSLIFTIPFTIKRNKKAKKLLNQISDAKTGKEILLEQTKNELERDKLKDKNKVLEKALGTLSLQELMINNLKENYEITKSKNEDVAIDEIVIIKKEKESELEKISTQKFLSKRFSNIRDKFYGSMNNIVQIVMPVTMITLMSTAFPYALVGQFHNFSMYHNANSILTVLAPAIIPLALSIGGSSLYIKNLSNKEKKVFRKLNSNLGKDSLSKTEDNKEYNLQNELDLKISELAELTIIEKNAQRNIESAIALETNEKERQDYIERQLANLRPYIKEELEDDIIVTKEEGKTLVKR